jgi:uncharacterized membrane protein YjjP (DUF1212 family)
MIQAAVVVSGGSGNDAIHSLLYLVIVGIVLGILYYLVTIAPFLPDLFKKVLGWLIILFGAIFLINVLLGFTGHPIFTY